MLRELREFRLSKLYLILPDSGPEPGEISARFYVEPDPERVTVLDLVREKFAL